MIGLNRLNIDEEAVVAKIGEKSRRAQDLGLVEGTKVKCVLRSPLEILTHIRYVGRW